MPRTKRRPTWSDQFSQSSEWQTAYSPQLYISVPYPKGGTDPWRPDAELELTGLAWLPAFLIPSSGLDGMQADVGPVAPLNLGWPSPGTRRSATGGFHCSVPKAGNWGLEIVNWGAVPTGGCPDLAVDLSEEHRDMQSSCLPVSLLPDQIKTQVLAHPHPHPPPGCASLKAGQAEMAQALAGRQAMLE